MLATSPAATGSVPLTKTIGMVEVAALAASAGAAPPLVKMTETCFLTSSDAIASSRSSWLSAQRYSIGVLAPNIAGFGQAFEERGDQERILLGCRAAENADNGPGLLRARGLRTEDRCRHRAAEKRDERAALHSITSSTRPIIGSGTVRPSALAVFMLMTSSTLVACWTGSSAGFSPLRIRPV